MPLLRYEFTERMNKEVDEDFYEKRRDGENDDYLCQLIRNNKINEFNTFVYYLIINMKLFINFF